VPHRVPLWLDKPNNIWWAVQIMNLLVFFIG